MFGSQATELVRKRSGSCHRVHWVWRPVVPAQQPDSRYTPVVRLVGPACHLSRQTEDVAYKAHPIGIVAGPGASDRSAIREVSAFSAQVIAKYRVVDRVAVGLVAVPIESVVSLEEHVMRADHVARVEADLDPAQVRANVPVVHVVVTDDRSGAGAPRHHHLVRVDRDVVLDQDLRRTIGERDVVATSARLHPHRSVNVGISNLHPERIVDREPFA